MGLSVIVYSIYVIFCKFVYSVSFVLFVIILAGKEMCVVFLLCIFLVSRLGQTSKAESTGHGEWKL